MSYFECEHGKKYYPFGKGGRENLLKALIYAAEVGTVKENSSSDSSNNSNNSSSSNSAHDHSHDHNHSAGGGCGSKGGAGAGGGESKASLVTLYDRLLTCPLHRLPLSEDVSGSSTSSSSSSGGSDTTTTSAGPSEYSSTNAEVRAALDSIDPSSPVQPSAAAAGPVLPVVLRCPNSSAAKVYTALADDMILGIYKMHLDAQILPTVTFIENRGIVLRYFTAHEALEFVIPPVELRIREPNTGKLREKHEELREKLMKSGKSGGREGSGEVIPVRFDFKGNYGVGIAWSDGHHGEIYHYNVLRKVAEELNVGKK
jgi:Gamma-butyrobetaine hydroxylase-like, N-terminal